MNIIKISNVAIQEALDLNVHLSTADHAAGQLARVKL